MNGAWSDGAPVAQRATSVSPSSGASDSRAAGQTRPAASRTIGMTERVAKRVSRVRQFEGQRGYSSRATLVLRYVNYFLLIALFCGLTGLLTRQAAVHLCYSPVLLFQVAARSPLCFM